MADIPHQHQRTAFQAVRHASAVLIGVIRVQFTGECFAAFADRFGQIAFHQAQPVGIGQNLVFGINRGNRIFAIHNRRHRAFQQNIGNTRRISLANHTACIVAHIDMQAIVAQDDPAFGRPCEMFGIFQGVGHIGQIRHTCPTARCQRGHIV